MHARNKRCVGVDADADDVLRHESMMSAAASNTVQRIVPSGSTMETVLDSLSVDRELMPRPSLINKQSVGVILLNVVYPTRCMVDVGSLELYDSIFSLHQTYFRKQGTMVKLSGTRKGVWQNRFFILKDYMLTYFDGKFTEFGDFDLMQDSVIKQKGVLNLSLCEGVAIVQAPGDKTAQELCIALKFEDRTYFMKCTAPVEMHAW